MIIIYVLIIIALRNIYNACILTRGSQTWACIIWRTCVILTTGPPCPLPSFLFCKPWVRFRICFSNNCEVVLMLPVQDHTLTTTAVDQGLANYGLYFCKRNCIWTQVHSSVCISSMAVFMLRWQEWQFLA